MSNIEMGTVYEMNRNVAAAQKELSRTELKKGLREIKYFFLENPNKYFMLLCREKYDFTLFNLKHKRDFSIHKIIQDLEECLSNRGQILSIDLTDAKDAFEIWIKIDNKAYVYYLFPYDIGVIEEV